MPHVGFSLRGLSTCERPRSAGSADRPRVVGVRKASRAERLAMLIGHPAQRRIGDFAALGTTITCAIQDRSTRSASPPCARELTPAFLPVRADSVARGLRASAVGHFGSRWSRRERDPALAAAPGTAREPAADYELASRLDVPRCKADDSDRHVRTRCIDAGLEYSVSGSTAGAFPHSARSDRGRAAGCVRLRLPRRPTGAVRCARRCSRLRAISGREDVLVRTRARASAAPGTT